MLFLHNIEHIHIITAVTQILYLCFKNKYGNVMIPITYVQSR